MPYDLVIKNGMVVDGSGFSRYRADVAVKDGAIVEIGKIRGAATSTIDAEGHFVAPGIIDTHTHYDAQPFWDKLCTSSIWHGVTTVLMGNCGLTLAPLRPEHRDAMLATFCCVEDIPVRSLASVVPWNWENFDEYLNAIDIGLGLNLMPLVGHNPLRLSAMDQAAWDRAATPDEIAHMQRLLRESLEAGAWGWSTTDSPTHAGPQGQPVPSRLAADEERVAFGRTLGGFNRGLIEILPKGAGKPSPADLDHLRDVAVASGRPVFFLSFDTNAWPYVQKASRGRAALQPAAGDPVQSAIHAEEDDLLPQPRRVGRRHAPARPRAAGRARRPRAAREDARPGPEAAAAAARRGGPARALERDLRPQGEARQEPGTRRPEPDGARREAEQARRGRHARPGA